MRPAKRACPPSKWASEAERSVWHLDNSDGDDRRFRHEIFRQWPNRIAYPVAQAYRERHDTQGLREANLFLLDLQDKFKPSSMALAWNDDELVSEAERASKQCREALALYPGRPDETLRLLLRICNRYRLDAAPVTATDTVTEKEPRIRVGQTAHTFHHKQIKEWNEFVSAIKLAGFDKGIRHNNGKQFRIGARDGVDYYSDHPKDLGNCDDYQQFIESLAEIMSKVFMRLREDKYCSLILSDFTVNKTEVCVQADVVMMMQEIGFEFCGTTVLLQPVKPLYPFGYPYRYKINHHHQNIMTFMKPKSEAEKPSGKRAKKSRADSGNLPPH